MPAEREIVLRPRSGRQNQFLVGRLSRFNALERYEWALFEVLCKPFDPLHLAGESDGVTKKMACCVRASPPEPNRSVTNGGYSYHLRCSADRVDRAVNHIYESADDTRG